MFSLSDRVPENPGVLPTVLVAEDDRDDGLLLRRAFRKEGVRASVRFVSDGEQAIQYLEGSGQYGDRSKYPLPVLVLLDLSMPRMGGLAVLNWIQSRRIELGMPVVVLSGSAAPVDIERVVRAGAKACITKPQDPAELLEVVRKLKKHLQEPEAGSTFGLAGVGSGSAKEFGSTR